MSRIDTNKGLIAWFAAGPTHATARRVGESRCDDDDGGSGEEYRLGACWAGTHRG